MEKQLEIGARIWIPCKVTPGPFTNERMFRIISDDQDVGGFVCEEYLKDKIFEGETSIQGSVTGIDEHRVRFIVRFPADTFAVTQFEGMIANVKAPGECYQ